MISKLHKLTKELWWAVVAGGAVSIIFGLVIMLWPQTTLNIFIYLFSIFVLAVSVIVLGQAFVNIKVDRLWWMSMLFAICGICIGLYIIINPNVAMGFIAVLLSVYIFCQSLMDLMVASYSDDHQAKTPVVIAGIIGIIFGFVVLFQPQLATTALVWVIGLYIFAHGVVAEYYAVKVRSCVKKISKAMEIPEVEVVDEPVKKSKATRAKTTKKSK